MDQNVSNYLGELRSQVLKELLERMDLENELNEKLYEQLISHDGLSLQIRSEINIDNNRTYLLKGSFVFPTRDWTTLVNLANSFEMQ